MDLTAYEEAAETLDYYRDSSRELKDVLPFEIYEFIFDELINYYADESDTFDMVMRATSDRFALSGSCIYSDLPDFKMILTNLTKEEVERMVYPEQMLAPEYVDMIYDTWTNGDVRSILEEYLLREMREPRYFVFNPYTIAYEELTEENKHFIMESGVVYAYLGTNAMPDAYEAVLAVPAPFFDINGMSLEEVMEVLENSQAIATQMFGDITGNY